MPNAVIAEPKKVDAKDPRTLVAEAVKKVSTIATLPEVTARIVSTVEDPKSTASQLHKIVAHDPALVTRILKVVNSAFYGLPGQIGSVERAIVLLGLNAVKNIAVAASLGQLFRGVKLCEGLSAKDLWQHCIAVAVTARELARQMKLPIADEAFLAGLIHDVGLLVSLHVSPEKLRAVCEKTKAEGGDFCAHERELCGVDHQQLGLGLTEQWKFTRSCQLVAGFHHQPQLLADNSRLLVTLVYVADTICCQGKGGFNLTAMEQKLTEGAVGDVDLSPAIIEKTQAKLEELVASAVSVLDENASVGQAPFSIGVVDPPFARGLFGAELRYRFVEELEEVVKALERVLAVKVDEGRPPAMFFVVEPLRHELLKIIPNIRIDCAIALNPKPAA